MKYFNFIIVVVLMFACCFHLRAASPNWVINPHNYLHTMNGIIQVKMDNVPFNVSDTKIAIFVGSELRGVVDGAILKSGMAYFPITLYSNTFSGENLTFKVYATFTDTIYIAEENAIYDRNKTLGKFLNPFILNIHPYCTEAVITCEGPQTIALDGMCKLMVPDLIDGATASDYCATSLNWSQSIAAGTLISSGEGTKYTLTVSANDGMGHTSNCSVVITADDTTPPAITCELSQTINLDASCKLKVPNLIDGAIASDNCTSTMTWSQSISSGTLLASGEGIMHSIVVTANDGNGNSSSCTVIVTGDDVTLPSLVCEDPVNINVNTECKLLIPNLTDQTNPKDNCATSFSWTQSTASGSLISSGEGIQHIITVTIYDGNGNSATCTTVLTGRDVTNPVMTCLANQVRSNTVGQCKYLINGNEFDGTSSDNCVIAEKSYLLSGATSGSGTNFLNGVYLNKGITTIKWTVKDAANRTASCSFNVDVKDTELPKITCPLDKTVTTAPAQCTISSGSVPLGTPVVSDNCAVKYPLTNNSPSTYPLGVTNVKWTVTDVNTNTNTCIQKITVIPYTCGQPSQVYHTDTTFDKAKIKWKAGKCSTENSLRIRKELSPGVWGPWTDWIVSSGPGLLHQFTGLEENSFYHYQIRSKCGISYSGSVNGWFHTLPTFGGTQNRVRAIKLNKDELVYKPATLEIVPNPAQDEANLFIEGFEEQSKVITMIDLYGKMVFNLKLEAELNSIALDLKALGVHNGLYLVRVANNTQQKTVQFMIKN
ncbi:MAG: HYR domain-containing protein [Saprospiraceae bacterium]